jgi:GNAT superfamily N-acetyltransferase
MRAFQVREADRDDAAGIAALVSELGYPTTTGEMIGRLADLLSDPTYVTFVSQGDELVGLAGATLSRYFERNGLYARLVILAVADAVRGQGVGSDLVSAVERWAISRWAKELVLSSGNHRHEAHRFYESRGFGATGIRFVKQLKAAG